MTLSLSLLHVLMNWKLSLSIASCSIPRESSLRLGCWVFTFDVIATKAVNQLAAQVVAAESAHPDSVIIILGDFNHTNLKKVLPRYKQHLDCAIYKNKILDHYYTVFKDAYHATTMAPLRESDHATGHPHPPIPTETEALKPTK